MTTRYKHGGKRGQHLQRLSETGNSQEREAAEEKRKKKKEKKAVRKGKGGHDHMESDPKETSKKSLDDFMIGDDDGEDDDENILPDPKEIKKRMMKHVDNFTEYLKGVRGSEPTPELFDDIVVTDAYGKGSGSAPLKSVAQVVISSPTLAVATCFDPTTAKAVTVAIQKSTELNPQKEEGGVIKIPLPRPTLESRQNAVKSLHQIAEKYRVRIRTSRSNSLKIVKKGIAGNLEHVSKDDAFRAQTEIETIVEQVTGKLNGLCDQKEKSIMTV